MAKSRLYDGDQHAAWTIHRIVRDYMALLSPICPFFTHHITTTLYDSSAVDVRQFPEMPVDSLVAGSDEGRRLCDLTASIVEFNSDTWRTKKEAGISLNQPVSGITIPDDLQEFTSILTSMHSLE